MTTISEQLPIGITNEQYTTDQPKAGPSIDVVTVATYIAKGMYLPVKVAGKTGGFAIRSGFALAGKEADRRLTDMAATLAAGAVAIGAVVNGYNELTEHDSAPAAFAAACNDAGHQAVVIGNDSKVDGLFPKDSVRGTFNKLSLGNAARDDRTWSDIAASLSATTGPESRGYTITPASLAALNPELATYDTKNKLDSDISQYGPACINLPGPLFFGIRLSDGKAKASDIALENGLTLNQLETLNPGITAGDQVVEQGKVIRVRKAIDTSLVLRAYSEQKLSEVTTNPQIVNRIKIANDLDVHPGDNAYLPIVETNAMEHMGINTQDIVAQYKDSATHISPEQTIQPKVEKDAKNPTEVSTTMQDGMDMLRMQLFGVPTTYAAYYLEYGRKYGVSPLLLAAQGRQESGYQSHRTSSANAQGPAQILPPVFAQWKHSLGLPADASIEDPRYAIQVQAAIMASNMESAAKYNHTHGGHYSDAYVAASMYNGGVYGVQTQGVQAAAPGYASNIIQMTDTMQRYLRTVSPSDAKHKTSAHEQAPEVVRGARYYSQTDLRWAFEPYNQGHAAFNIGGYGCAPTSEAIVMSSLTGRLFNPVDMARFNIANGYVSSDASGGGTDGEAAAYGMARAFDLQATSLNVHDGLNDKMKRLLDKGGLIIINGYTAQAGLDIPATSGGHVYVIDGYTKDGELTILNPDSISQTQRSWNPSKLFPYASYAVGLSR